MVVLLEALRGKVAGDPVAAEGAEMDAEVEVALVSPPVARVKVRPRDPSMAPWRTLSPVLTQSKGPRWL